MSTSILHKDQRSVLIVDDEPGIRAALTAHFAREGWQAAAAGSVREAEYRLAQGEFDLVLTDVRLPDGSGTDLLRIAQGTPVVLLTAHGTVPDAVEALRGGARDYLLKPVAWAQLRAAVERVAGEQVSRVSLSACAEPEPEPTAAAPMKELERMHLERTLALAAGNRTHAAEMLGISVRTVRNRIREYGLPPRRYA